MDVAVTTILSPIHVDYDKGYKWLKWIQLVSGLHVSGINAVLETDATLIRTTVRLVTSNCFTPRILLTTCSSLIEK